jgi:hypothetical protein
MDIDTLRLLTARALEQLEAAVLSLIPADRRREAGLSVPFTEFRLTLKTIAPAPEAMLVPWSKHDALKDTGRTCPLPTRAPTNSPPRASIDEGRASARKKLACAFVKDERALVFGVPATCRGGAVHHLAGVACCEWEQEGRVFSLRADDMLECIED